MEDDEEWYYEEAPPIPFSFEVIEVEQEFPVIYGPDGEKYQRQKNPIGFIW